MDHHRSQRWTDTGKRMIGCEVEEYPFGNSQIGSAGKANYNDRPTLRLIPQEENTAHGVQLGQFIKELKKNTQKTNPTYCMFCFRPSPLIANSIHLGVEVSSSS